MEQHEQISPTLSSRFKKVCVFCGSSIGKKDAYRVAAIEMAQELVSRSLDLVYGGGSIGLMGIVSKTVLNGGCHVTGVIPTALMNNGITGEAVGEVIPVDGMHQRKAEMVRRSDCFIALPGGYGTLEELLEVITWAQLGVHAKPVGLLNVDGFYDLFLKFIDNVADEEFILPAQRHILVSAPSAKELFQKLEVGPLCKNPWIYETLEYNLDHPNGNGQKGLTQGEYEPVHGALDRAMWEVEQPEPEPEPEPVVPAVGFTTTPPLEAEVAL